jgi:hypothetical protein
MLYPYVAPSPSPTDARHLVFENFEKAGIRVTERRFAAKDMILRRRSRRKDRDQGTATIRRGLIEMIQGMRCIVERETMPYPHALWIDGNVRNQGW